MDPVLRLLQEILASLFIVGEKQLTGETLEKRQQLLNRKGNANQTRELK
ncbi:9163_t:CDS:2 [Entrophospora sp. SA101]|nr:9163_t:CDS:2 [Entrophospora sp. SA101]